MAENTANIRVTANEQQVDQLARSVDRLGDELSQADRQAQGLGMKMANVASGMLTAEVAMRAAEIGMRALTASFEAFAQTSEETQQAQQRLNNTIQDAAQRFGRSVFGNGRAADVMNNFSAAVQEADIETSDLVVALQGLLEITDLLITSYRVLNGQIEVAGINFGFLGDALGYLNPLTQLPRLFGATGDAARVANDALGGSNGTAAAIGKITDEIKELNEVAGTSGTFFSDFVRGNLEAGLETARDLAPTAPTGGLGETVEQRTARAAAEGLATIQRLNQQNNEDLRRLDEARVAEQERVAREMADMRMAQLAKEQALRDYELEQYQRDLDDRTKRYETWVEGIIALDEKKARERERIEQMVGPSIERTAATLANFEAKNAKERKELAKQTIADILAAEGRALIGKGVGNLIALNPIGAAQIAGGTAMVGAARAISGTVSGGGGGGGQATPRQNVQAGSQTIINPTVSFGFVGDRRAAYRDVEEANRRALERT